MFPMQSKILEIVPIHLQQYMQEVFEKYQINTVFRAVHFLSQVMHESGDFKYKEENLNYSEHGLLSTFPKYFDADSARTYARKPERIANKVYANRYGNGNEQSGDGWKYRGRGFIQCTFKDNYQALSNATETDFVNNPDTLKEDKYAILSAGWFWNMREINCIADKGLIDEVIRQVRKSVNGGYNGIREVTDKLNWICNRIQ